jgi:hypothetical protein
MKIILAYRLVFAALAVFFFTSAESHARVFGVGVGVGVGGVGVGAVAVRGVAVAGVASAYYRSIPPDYRAVVYGGYNCYYAGGVYYRPVIYGGETVYVVVQ